MEKQEKKKLMQDFLDSRKTCLKIIYYYDVPNNKMILRELDDAFNEQDEIASIDKNNLDKLAKDLVYREGIFSCGFFRADRNMKAIYKTLEKEALGCEENNKEKEKNYFIWLYDSNLNFVASLRFAKS
jgi:hypothetical protein